MLVLTVLSSGCVDNASSGSTTGLSSAGPVLTPKFLTPNFKILATTLMIADSASKIAGDQVEVISLMGPGVDPHLYQPTAQDRFKLQAADVVLYHGLHLEGNMVEILESFSGSKRVVAVSRDIPPEKLLSWGGDLHDPHIWHDVSLWKMAVETIAATLIKHDAAGAAGYRIRADEHLTELAELHQFCLKKTGQLDPSQRTLITSHDAFNYFGRAYGLDVIGIQGISTDSQAGLKAIIDTVDLIKERNVRAIFPESSVPPAAIAKVAQDSGAILGPELYSDSIGALGSGADTYVSMIKTNVNHIVELLQGASAARESQ